METQRKAKGSWGVRFFIAVLGVILGVLFFWLLTFVEGDIGTMPGPDWNAVRSQYVTPEQDTRQTALAQDAAALERRILTQTEQQQMLSSSTGGLQNTINQLLRRKKR